jgi:hypothetical protein
MMLNRHHHPPCTYYNTQLILCILYYWDNIPDGRLIGMEKWEY